MSSMHEPLRMSRGRLAVYVKVSVGHVDTVAVVIDRLFTRTVCLLCCDNTLQWSPVNRILHRLEMFLYNFNINFNVKILFD